MKLNAAGHHCIYLTMQVCISQKADQIINIKGFIPRIIEMNNYLSLMPCLKDVEGAPSAFKRADVPLKGIDCTLILGTLPYTLVCVYWDKKEPNNLPTDPTKLVEDLTALEPHVKQTQKLIQSVKSEHGRQKSTQNGSGKPKAEQPIPRKCKGGDEPGQDLRKAARNNCEPLKGAHLCTRFKK